MASNNLYLWRIIFFPADIFSLDSQLNVKIPIKRNINSSDMSLTILKSTYHRKKQKTPRMWGSLFHPCSDQI